MNFEIKGDNIRSIPQLFDMYIERKKREKLEFHIPTQNRCLENSESILIQNNSSGSALKNSKRESMVLKPRLNEEETRKSLNCNVKGKLNDLTLKNRKTNVSSFAENIEPLKKESSPS